MESKVGGVFTGRRLLFLDWNEKSLNVDFALEERRHGIF